MRENEGYFLRAIIDDMSTGKMILCVEPYNKFLVVASGEERLSLRVPNALRI